MIGRRGISPGKLVSARLGWPRRFSGDMAIPGNSAINILTVHLPRHASLTPGHGIPPSVRQYGIPCGVSWPRVWSPCSSLVRPIMVHPSSKGWMNCWKPQTSHYFWLAYMRRLHTQGNSLPKMATMPSPSSTTATGKFEGRFCGVLAPRYNSTGGCPPAPPAPPANTPVGAYCAGRAGLPRRSPRDEGRSASLPIHLPPPISRL